MLANFYPHAFEFSWADKRGQQFVDSVIDFSHRVPSDSTIIGWCCEYLAVQSVIDFMSQLQGRIDRDIIWVLDDNFYDETEKQLILSVTEDIYFIDFGFLGLHFELDVYKSSTSNDRWNPSTGKFLFLTGKPHRLNRIRLLYKFSQKGLLPNCIWSFFMTPSLEHACRDFLKELSDTQYKEFIMSHQRDPDGLCKSVAGQSFHADGYPFDKQIFEQTSFRVIAETMMSNHPIITEKTWVTMVNRLPFIIMGYPHTLSVLERLGFRTFQGYLPVAHYDSILDDERRLDAVIQNTEYWLSHISDHQEDISQDIDFNFRLLQEKLSATSSQMHAIYSRLNDPNFEKFRIFPYPPVRANWINFYYGVKGVSWPDCWSEKNFVDLPSHIQTELITVHGYQPNDH